MKAFNAIIGIVVQASIATLVGCSGDQSHLGDAGVNVLPRNERGLIDVGAAKRSWMLPAGKQSTLLYVPNFLANVVDIYSYPAGTYVGSLTGFDGPSGACTDNAHDVWIVNQSSAQIVEYAHGGTSAIATLTDPGQAPIDCAVDPKSGDLGVTNQSGTDHQGSVAIFKNASGSGQLYTDNRQIYWFYYCGYDGSGNLFVDGTQFPYYFPVGQFQYAELPAGSATFTNLTIQPSRKINWPGGIHWDGTYMTLMNPTKGVLYRLSGDTVVSTIRLKGGASAVDFALDQGAVIAGLDNGPKLVKWEYPAGGHSVNAIRLSKRRNPAPEVVISK
jgi:hypothetical protein